jgi:signal transduction histidine kinase
MSVFGPRGLGRERASTAQGHAGPCNDSQSPKEPADRPSENERYQREFVAYVSHELRNALAPILYSLEIMNRQKIDNPILQSAREVMARQVNQLDVLVDDLFDFCRLAYGVIQLEKETLALSDVIARAVDTSAPFIHSGRHQLIMSLPQEAIHLEADGARLVQVFVNLLNNACKYTDPRGTIHVSASQHAEQAIISVRDTGIGIPKEMLAEVFDMFKQVGRSLGKSQGGLGIGLWVVRMLVQLHGGTVRAHSDGSGFGSTFVVQLPCLPIAI